jgi:hypothetical protein
MTAAFIPVPAMNAPIPGQFLIWDGTKYEPSINLISDTQTAFVFLCNTPDGNDVSSIKMYSGNSVANNSRGASIELYGNEHVAHGFLRLTAGDDAGGGTITFVTASTGWLTLSRTGVLSNSSSISAVSVSTGAINAPNGGLGIGGRAFLGSIGGTFSGNVLAGVQDGTAFTAGAVGEIVESKISIAQNAAGTGTYLALTSVSLTAGDWDISASAIASPNGATVTVDGAVELLLGTTSASNSGTTVGYDRMVSGQPIASGVHITMAIPAKRVNINTTTIYYLNVLATFTVGTPQFQGSITARRAR